MTDLHILRTEWAQVSDRDLLLEILDGQRQQNGAIAEIKADYYGDINRKIRGTKAMVISHETDINRARTTVRTLIGFLGAVGIGNIWAWVTVLGRG